jgi:hypothetical protein
VIGLGEAGISHGVPSNKASAFAGCQRNHWVGQKEGRVTHSLQPKPPLPPMLLRLLKASQSLWDTPGPLEVPRCTTSTVDTSYQIRQLRPDREGSAGARRTRGRQSDIVWVLNDSTVAVGPEQRHYKFMQKLVLEQSERKEMTYPSLSSSWAALCAGSVQRLRRRRGLTVLTL